MQQFKLTKIAVCVVATVMFCASCKRQRSELAPYRIAHAGGGINGKVYTNSYEALNHNLERGFRFFEIDFSYTSDQKLVCLHDWGPAYEQIFAEKTEAPISYEKFEKLSQFGLKFEPCTLQGLATWMGQHPQTMLVTDVKAENIIKPLRTISNEIPDFAERVIVQIYTPEEYKKVKSLGYKYIIWTLYRYKHHNIDVLERCKKMELFAVTMPAKRALSGLGLLLESRGIHTYAHTVNDPKGLAILQQKCGINEVYTDFLPPE